MESLPAPLHIIQDSRYTAQDHWRFDDISLCSSGNIAVSGGNYRTYQSYVSIYGSTTDDNFDSRDKPTLLYHKQFTHKEMLWRRRRISFMKPNSTEIVTCLNDEVQVIDYNRDVVVRSRKVNDEATCLSVSEGPQIFIGLHRSDIVNIYDNELNEIKSIRLEGIRDNEWPRDIAVSADRLYVCTHRHGRGIAYSQDSGSIVTEYTAGQGRSLALSIVVIMKLGLTAVVWNQVDAGQDNIIFYLLTENKSFLTANVEYGVTRIRISEEGRIVTGNAETGEVRIHNLVSLFSYSRLKESLVSRLGRNDCEKLAHFFTLGGDELNSILNSGRPASTLLLGLEEKGVMQPSNVDKLEEAFLELEMSALYQAVNVYQKLNRDQITSYDSFLATLSTHLTSSVPAELCDYFHVSDEQKESIIFGLNPGLSLLLVLDELGIITPSEVGCLEEPLKKFRLVQALAKIDEYKEIVKEENRKLLQTFPPILEDKGALLVEFLKKKIKSWYEAMTPVPWKKSCQWKSTDLFVGSGLILTDSKAKQNVQNIDEQCKLNYTEIFTNEKLKSEIRIILEGDPGAGKTMLSSQLAYDWSEGKIDGVDILIFLPLKIFENKTLIQAVKEFYIPTNTPLSENDIESILASDTERICLLLDGLEEYSTGARMKAKESSEVMKIMKKEKHSNCKVVITCRSDFAHDLPECPMLKLGRFGETERNAYIENLSPHNTDRQLRIKKIFQDNPFILDLCNVPLLFVLVVHNFESMSLSNKGQLNKVSPFIRSMILKLCSSSNVKHEVDGIRSKSLEREKITLGELAFNGLCKGHQQLSWQKDFMESSVTFLKVWVDSGILVLEEGLVISEKETQDASINNKVEKVKETTKKEKRKGTPDEYPVLSKDMVTASMDASKARHDASKIKKKHQHVSELKTEPREMKTKTVKRAAGQVPLTVKFLHKVIQEWFSATFFCSMMRKCTSENQFQIYVSSHLQHISPADLHYVLRFTSYLHPPSCHVIMNYLLRSYSKDVSVPPYIMNCVFLCFNEHNDVKGPDMRNAVTDVCKEVITIQSEDSRLLQQAKCNLLEYASNEEVIIEKLELKDVIFAADETSLSLNSGVQLEILHTVKLIEVSRWDQVLQKDDFKAILKLLSAGTLLKEVCCFFPSQPPDNLDEITLKNIMCKDLKVEWHIGHLVQSLDPKTGKWMINFKQPGTSSTEISEVSEDKDTMKRGVTMHTSTEINQYGQSVDFGKYSLAQETRKRRACDVTTETAIPTKRTKIVCDETPTSIVAQNQPSECQSMLEAKALITKNGGVVEIPNAGVVLMIPPGALPEGMEHCEIHIRIIPGGTLKEEVMSFSSNSSTVVEILPNRLKFRLPVRLTVPHCLVLKDTGDRKARIFVSHHVTGSVPYWEEQTHLTYHVEDTACIILMDSLCWVKVSIDDGIVKAKKLVVYTAVRKLQHGDKVAEIHVGYYMDLPDQKMVLNNARDLIVAQRKTFFYKKRKEKYPLRVSLDRIISSDWEYHPKEPRLRKIAYDQVASLLRQSVIYTLTKEGNTPENPLCVFTVSQESRQITVQLAAHLNVPERNMESVIKCLDQYGAPLKAEMKVTKAGGTLTLHDTDVKLEIPRDAIPAGKEECLVRMTISPTRVMEDEVSSFCANSCTAVEIYPSNLLLNSEAKLILPHCVKLKKKRRKARIFINKEEGSPSPWREQKNLKYELNDRVCVVHLKQLCCVKYVINENLVEGKRITLYTASPSVKENDAFAEVDVGYYSDAPGGGELLQLNPNLHIDSEATVLFKEEPKGGLTLFLDHVIPLQWKHCFPKKKPKKIPYKIIASSIEHSHLYVLQKQRECHGSVICKFTATQKDTRMSSEISLRILPQQDHPQNKEESEQPATQGADPMTARFQFLSKELGNDWKSVGRFLGLKDAALDNIEKDHTGIKEHIYQMLLKWKQEKGSGATTVDLIQSLTEAGRKDLADLMTRKDREDA